MEARALGKDVYDERTVVQQNPIGGAAVAFATGVTNSHLSELLFDSVADGANLRMAETGADEEVVGEGAELAEIEESDVLGLLTASGLHGAEEFRTQRVCNHR